MANSKYFRLTGLILLMALFGCEDSVVQPLPAPATPSSSTLTATLSLTSAVIGTTDGANSVTVTFNERVEPLSASNSGGEFTLSGCSTTQPSLTVTMGTNGSGDSVATVDLAAGICSYGDTITLSLNMDRVTDLSGLAGLSSANPTSVSYFITSDPVATLAAVTYPASQTGLNSTQSTSLILTFNNTTSTTLAAATGTSAAAPAGLSITENSGASCSTVAISSVSTSGATITVSGCSGNGSIDIQVLAGVATGGSGHQNAVSNMRSVSIDNTAPTATLAVTGAVVGTGDGANTATVTFSEMIQALSTNNSNGEFTLSGCTTANPAVAILMSASGGHSVATATLSAGTCADSDTVTITFHLDKATDLAGNAGSAGASPTPVTYLISTANAVASLASAVYSGASATGAVNSGGVTAATLSLTFTNAATTTLSVSSGTSASPPSGLSVIESGASCTSVAITSASSAGASIAVSGCSGDGTISVQVQAGTGTSAGGHANTASSTQLVLVQNTLPVVSTIIASNATAATDAANVIVVTFNELVQPLSVANGSAEFSLSGCTGGAPGFAVVMSDDGSGHSIATATLSAGTCTSGDTISIGFNTDQVKDLAGDLGSAAANPAPATYSIP